MVFNAETFLCCTNRFDVIRILSREILGKRVLTQTKYPPPLKIQKEKIEGLWTGYHCLGMYELEYVL